MNENCKVLFIIDRMVGGPTVTIQQFGHNGNEKLVDQIQNIYINLLEQIKNSGQFTDVKYHEYNSYEPFWRIICYNGNMEAIRYSWIIVL